MFFPGESFLASGSLLNVIFYCAFLLFGRGKKSNNDPAIMKEGTSDTSRSTAKNNTQVTERANATAAKRLIPQDQLEKSKRELRTILLEKELVSSALTRLFEAEAAGEITKEEREILGQKYRDELKSLNGKIMQMDAFIEVGDLETLREQLLQLVREKIDSIERRIERTQKAAEPLINEILSKRYLPPNESTTTEANKERATAKPKVPDVSDLLSTKPRKETIGPSTSPSSSQVEVSPEIDKTGGTPSLEELTSDNSVKTASPKRRASEDSDGQVEELQRELLEALDRLEKMDVEA